MANSKSEAGTPCHTRSQDIIKARKTTLELCQRDKGDCFTLFSWLFMINNFHNRNVNAHILSYPPKLCLKASKNLKIELTKAQSREVSPTFRTTFIPESNWQVLWSSWKADNFTRWGTKAQNPGTTKGRRGLVDPCHVSWNPKLLSEAEGMERNQVRTAASHYSSLPWTELRWSQTVHSLRCLAEASTNPV